MKRELSHAVSTTCVFKHVLKCVWLLGAPPLYAGSTRQPGLCKTHVRYTFWLCMYVVKEMCTGTCSWKVRGLHPQNALKLRKGRGMR